MATIPTRSIVIATTNRKKGGEMAQILSQGRPDLEFLLLDAFPSMAEVEESGDTFADNARLKAVAALRHTGMAAIADDGGLCIDALNGSPGVKSHRFLGVDTPFDVKMREILRMLAGTPDSARTCRFECAVCVVTPEGNEVNCAGVCEGRIGHELRGHHGFGYDPIFIVTDLGKHMAELAPLEKHRISHRGKALACALTALNNLIPQARMEKAL